MKQLTLEEIEVMAMDMRAILDECLPKNAYREVSVFNSFDKKPNIKIFIAASEDNIHGVPGQKPQAVSLALWNWEEGPELKPQVFGGNGGRCIYIEPNMENDRERYLAMVGVKIPFRKPKGEARYIYAAVERFCKGWVKALRTNRERLRYEELVDYETLLS